jgi:hypothetical protein
MCSGFSPVTAAGFRVMTLRHSDNPSSGDRQRTKSRECSSFALASRGLLRKNSSWQTIQPIPHVPCRFAATERKYAKTSLRTLATEIWLMHHANAPSHIFSFSGEFCTKNKTTVVPHLPYSSDLAPREVSWFPRMKLRPILTLTGEHPYRTRLPE